MTDRNRDITVRIALVVAALLLPLGMLSSWSSSILSDNDRYVDAVAPLASDPAVQDAVINTLTQTALTMFDQSKSAGPCGTTTTSTASTGGLGDLVGALLPLAAGPIRAIVTGIVQSPTFATAWTGANRSAHDQLIGVLKGDDALIDGNGCVSLDLDALLREAVPALQGLSGFIAVPELKAPVASIPAGKLHTARVAYSVLNPLGIWLPVLWVVAVGVAFALARRRGRTLWILGAVSAAGMVVLLLVLTAARHQIAGASGDPVITRAIWDAVAASIRNAALIGLAVSAVAGAAGAWLDWNTRSDEVGAHL